MCLIDLFLSKISFIKFIFSSSRACFIYHFYHCTSFKAIIARSIFFPSIIFYNNISSYRQIVNLLSFFRDLTCTIFKCNIDPLLWKLNIILWSLKHWISIIEWIMLHRQKFKNSSWVLAQINIYTRHSDWNWSLFEERHAWILSYHYSSLIIIIIVIHIFQSISIKRWAVRVIKFRNKSVNPFKKKTDFILGTCVCILLLFWSTLCHMICNR